MVKNGRMNSCLLVADVLPDALDDRDRRALQLQHAERDAVDVEHDVGALGVADLSDRDLLGDREVVLLRVLPVDEPDGLGLLAGTRLDLDAVAQQSIDVLVGLVEVAAAPE